MSIGKVVDDAVRDAIRQQTMVFEEAIKQFIDAGIPLEDMLWQVEVLPGVGGEEVRLVQVSTNRVLFKGRTALKVVML